MARLHSKWVGNLLRFFQGSTAILDLDGDNSAVDVKQAGGLKLAGTAVAATAAEINRACDLSARLVDATGATLAVTLATHDGKIVTFNKADGITATLPAATGTGAKFTFTFGTATSGGSTIIKVANATDEFRGLLLGADTDGAGATGYTWMAADNDDTLTFNGAATGGKLGDTIEIIDVATGLFLVRGFIQQSGGSEATPFSATVS